MSHVIYENFFLSNTVEDQLNSHLDLQRFCKVDNTLVGTAGMKRIIHSYRATNGTEKLTIGQGNSKSIEVSYTPVEYEIALAQNRFVWNDEHAMTDPMLVPVGMKHAGTDMFNTIQADIYGEFAKTSITHTVTSPDFDAFIDTAVKLGIENIEGVEIFALVHPEDMATVRKVLKASLEYTEGFARQGYVGSVAGVNLYTKADAKKGEIVVATRDAVTIFNKKGVEVEQITAGTRSETAANVRENTVFTRKYYVVALTDESKAARMIISA